MRIITRAAISCVALLWLAGCGAKRPEETVSTGEATDSGATLDPLTAEPIATDRNLEIVDMGRGERRTIELRYVEGCQTTVMVTKKSTEQTTANGVTQEAKVKTEETKTDSRTLGITPEGDFVVEVRMDKEIPVPGPEVVPLSSDSEEALSPDERSELQEMKERKPWKPVVTMTVAPNGAVKDFQINVPDEYPPAAKELLTQMIAGIVGAKLDGFPSMPVGIGAKWRNDMVIDYHVFHVEGKNVCELLDRTDEYIHLKCSSRMTIPRQTMNLPGELSAVKPVATGSIEVETDQRNWLGCPGNTGTITTKTRLDMEVTAPNGTIVNVTVNSSEIETTDKL